MTEVDALETRVTRLETQITAGFDKLEGLLRNEIDDLKREQLMDLRKANERLGDDQRRLWESVRILEQRENQRYGADKKISGISLFFSGGVGAFVTWIVTWLSTGGKPH